LHVYPAACGLCRDRYALGIRMSTVTQTFSHIVLPRRDKLLVHTGLESRLWTSSQ